MHFKGNVQFGIGSAKKRSGLLQKFFFQNRKEQHLQLLSSVFPFPKILFYFAALCDRDKRKMNALWLLGFMFLVSSLRSL